MKSHIVRHIGVPCVVSAIVAFGAWYFGGVAALLLVLILAVLETTLSFDNAVVNARILERMSPVWQERFLTWGILFAVFGTRFVLPILIVSVALFTSPIEVLRLMFSQPEEYGKMLDSVHPLISSFGGMFLLMVSLKYFLNTSKKIHWIQSIEARLSQWGRIEAVEIAIALIVLISLSSVIPTNQAGVLIAGIVGIVLFIVMEGVTSALSFESGDMVMQSATLFVYLNVLDSAFSLDGVVGAFALTSDIFIIIAGLGIGAYFVRAFTLYLVEQKTLTQLIYLEHGAHWAIFGLAMAMMVNSVYHIPEAVIGLVGLCFVVLSYYSSIRHMKND